MDKTDNTELEHAAHKAFGQINDFILETQAARYPYERVEKEVNLKDEIEKAFKEKFIDLVPASSNGITYNSYKKIARYFYLLGRKSL